ncbi:oxidoreductase [Rhodothalassium salexigens]|uniref:Gfo/Idh/MocA family protein n=1 Tax=Rhodothalassium salexigens TaxID=1086 RepID=UPI00191412E5|nr:Gfo/Idh/MocA family oxidoreductase [Rhodothalassium salexigens]MBK5911326.1 oxidoreductase [Rhodothalassium salexigens]
MTSLGFGIVGTGFIAGVIAEALGQAEGAHLAAVSSRDGARARAFADDHGGSAAAVEGHQALLTRDDVAAVYVAVPTVAKEEIALAAIAAGRHVLVDKPFLNEASARRMIDAAHAAGVLFMDATHFTHHPRTHALRAALATTIATPRSLHTAFYFPFSDKTNIRLNPDQEPTGAVGDMAWYSLRAAVEYLAPQGAPQTVQALAERDPDTGGVVRATGLIGFADGTSTTFDVGYTADTLAMDLHLIGTKGIVTMDDFVLDWANSFPFKNTGLKAGYVHRHGLTSHADARFVEVASDTPQQVLMVDRFADLARTGSADDRARAAAPTLATQALLDAVWAAMT